MRFNEILKLGFKWLKFKIFNRILPKQYGGGFYSTREVFRYFDINFFEVKNDINKEEYLTKIEHLNPDVIVSSNSLYFGDKILALPKFCINRHSSLLPSYGGLWPIFQALRNKEKYIGVSVHHMTSKIDDGGLICQRLINVEPDDTVDTLYQKSFAISAAVTLQALDLLNNNRHWMQSQFEKSYFSFPTKKEWRQFRRVGRAFI